MVTKIKAHRAMLYFVMEYKDSIVTTKEIKEWCIANNVYVGKETSIIPSDCCYNRVNKGACSHKDLFFEYVKSGVYKCLGENYPYTGNVIHAPKDKGGQEFVVEQWENGKIKWKK